MGLGRLHDTLAKPTTNEKIVYLLKHLPYQRSNQLTSLFGPIILLRSGL